MMNQVFSLKRFMQLVLSHWTENKKRYLLFVVAMISLLIFGAICLLSVAGASSADEDVQYATFMFALMIAGCIFSGTFLSNLNDKSKGITYVLLPASALEKLLCTMLFTIPLFVIVYIICYYIIDIPFVAICNSIKHQEYLLNKKNGNYNYDVVYYPYKVISLLHNVKRASNYSDWQQQFYVFQQFFYIFFSLQAFFLMGSAYFKKFAFVKTLLSGFVLFLFFSVLTLLIFKKHNMNGFENYFQKKPVIDSYYYFIGFMVWFFKLGLGCLFYLATYFYIKEKEI